MHQQTLFIDVLLISYLIEGTKKPMNNSMISSRRIVKTRKSYLIKDFLTDKSESNLPAVYYHQMDAAVNFLFQRI